MLDLQILPCETCSGINLADITGFYADDNLGGYGDPNVPENPAGFDTYSVSVWRPGSDRTGPADYTLNLLADVPEPDDSGHYNWQITAAMMGLTVIESGLWYFEATGTVGSSIFKADAEVPFLVEIQGKVDSKMKPYDPTCPCRDGCKDPLEAFRIYTVLSCGATCSSTQFNNTLAHLRQLIKACC